MKRATEELARIGVTVTPEPQPLRIVLSSKLGPKKQEKLQTMKEGKAVPLETITAQNVTHRAQIMLNGKELWERHDDHRPGPRRAARRAAALRGAGRPLMTRGWSTVIDSSTC